MSLKTLQTALETCTNYGSTPWLGGGEPTVHPLFERFLLEAMATPTDEGHMGIITNGKIKRRAMMIVRLAHAGVIHAELSRDQYHDAIDMEVVYAFEDIGSTGSGWNSAIRDTSSNGRTPLPHGRGKVINEWDDDYHEDSRSESDCPCDIWVVKPNGDIYQCGCEDSPKIGTVDEGVDTELIRACCRSPEWRDECLDLGLEHLVP